MVLPFILIALSVGWAALGLSLAWGADHWMRWWTFAALFLIPAGLVAFFAWRAFSRAVRAAPPEQR